MKMLSVRRERQYKRVLVAYFWLGKFYRFEGICIG